MENNTPDKQTRLDIEATQDKAIAKVNKRVIYFSAIAILVVLVCAGAGYWWYASQDAKYTEEIGRADIQENDSVKFEMYKKIADAGSFKANERAKLNVAIKYYKDGKYEDALKYLDGVSVKSEVIQTGVYALQGDCYANLKKYDDAVKCFGKALDSADDNPQLVPFVLVKMANIYRVQKNYEKEYEVYNTLRTDYPGFVYDIDKYYERAKAAAGK